MQSGKTKPSKAELVAMLQTPGWKLTAGNKTTVADNRTLAELAKTTYERHRSGEAAGLVSRVESALELDLIQLQELWEHLGLPM